MFQILDWWVFFHSDRVTYILIYFFDFKVIVEKAERSEIPNIDKKK